jgi:hypothetical protein
MHGGGGASVSGGKEAVNHPSHYNMGKIEVIDAIEDWKLGFHAGNVVKYVSVASAAWGGCGGFRAWGDGGDGGEKQLAAQC